MVPKGFSLGIIFHQIFFDYLVEGEGVIVSPQRKSKS